MTGCPLSVFLETIAVPSYNFGLQAGLGRAPDLVRSQKVLRSGDTAILVLEYSHYTDDRWNEVSSEFSSDAARSTSGKSARWRSSKRSLSLPPLRVFDVLMPRDKLRQEPIERTARDGQKAVWRSGADEPFQMRRHGGDYSSISQSRSG